jgi:hypothetical protein
MIAVPSGRAESSRKMPVATAHPNTVVSIAEKAAAGELLACRLVLAIYVELSA